MREPFYDASVYELRQPPSAALRQLLRTIAHGMSQLLPSAAPGEPRPPVIGEESYHVRGEGGERPVTRAVAMETAQDADEYLKQRSSWGEGGAEGGPSPSYTATSTPPYLRYAGGLRALLNDKEGVEHFKTYLKEEGCPEMLYFWYACEGVRQQCSADPAADPAQFRQLIRAIYKRFVRPRRRGGRAASVASSGAAAAEREPAELPLSEDVRTEIAERVQDGRLDADVFDSAQAEVEAEMNRTLYPNFLKSDYYIQLVQGGGGVGGDGEGESVEGSSCASSVCGPPCPAAGLPTLHEEHEGSAGGSTTGAAPGPAVAPALTRGALLATQDKRALIQPTGRRKPDRVTTSRPGLPYQAPGLPLPRPVNPYHTLYNSYNPVSRQDSELQSMSSEALTDDTGSRAGSSVRDGRSGHYNTRLSQKRIHKLQRQMMRESARQNQESMLQNMVIPRTQRPTVPQIDPTRNVQEFARLLSSKLERVIVEREMMDSGVDSKRLLQDAIGKLGKLAVENEQEILESQSHRAPRDPTRRSRQSLMDPDSGVSVVSADLLPARTRPADKVLMWMQQTERDEASVRHRARSAHAAPMPPSGRRPPAAPLPYNSSRSGSLDRAAEEERRGRSRLSDSQMQAAPFNSLKRHQRPPKPQARGDADEMLCIAYTFCGEEVPYMTRVPSRYITLKQFKQLLPRKGNYRYFFKTECPDFETGVIQEEVSDDSAPLPLWEGKVHGQVMSRD
ncbi:Axin-1 [Amphibalanus amphitrite]|uniref:Axin-1 n=1 Tax=Amphibalanus amphitrite TaxID=1232801 RepID=A0A6A4WAU7_AMPAM|nr:Axin-1 [Amphibalanus amphitrite]